MTVADTPSAALAPHALAPEDLADLREAVDLLERDTFSETVMNTVGKVIGGGVGAVTRFLPKGMRDGGTDMLSGVLEKAFDKVILTVDQSGDGLTGRRWLDRPLSSVWFDRASAVIAGALGGAGGLATTAVELPVTTAFLMRGIAQIAVREGEDLSTEEAKLECLKVFAMGGGAKSDSDDAGYYAVRLAVAEAAPKLAQKGLQELLPKLLARVAERFSAPVTTKLGSQAAPGIGAAAGALINLAFVDHFQRKATGHFRVRRLERTYGAETVRAMYDALNAERISAKAGKKAKGKARTEA